MPFVVSWGRCGFMLSILLLLTINAEAQQIKVLPANGNFSQEVSPQGNLRFQRYFYLITADEMASSGIQPGMNLNSLGFSIAATQGDTARGNFRVYLQNTNDSESRIDTNWTTSISLTNSFDTTGLILGGYEWQVQSVCPSGTSTYSSLASFVTADTSDCNRPDNLTTTSISETSAQFNWTTPYSSNFANYFIEYKKSTAENWISDTTIDTFYLAAGLSSGTDYQWRVRTICSGGGSPFSAASFSTNGPDVCAEPSMLNVDMTTDTSASLSWMAAPAANYYFVQYRRIGSPSWNFNIPFSNSIIINGLAPGTMYEWRIRTVCTLGEGAFVAGSNFSTTGSAFCYSPEGLRANVLNDTSAMLSWLAVPGATSYNVRYRLRNSISWDSAVWPMDLVHSDSITIPDTIGVFEIPFSGLGITPVSYTGTGMYIAWEYSGRTGPLSTSNTVLATTANKDIKDKNGLDSITFVLSLATRNDTSASSHKEILLQTKIRPETWLGSPGLNDSVEVAAVYALGHHALSYVDTAHISALIINHSALTKQYPVTLTIKDQASNAIRYTTDSLVTIAGHSSALVLFNGWIPGNSEIDSIIVSVAGQGTENVLGNNRNFFLQQVNNSTLAYDDGSGALTNAGFGNGSGLILTRQKMDLCGSVNAARIYLDFSTKDKEVYAVIMNESGTLIDSSDVFTPDSTQVNRYHTFFFPRTPFFNESDFYIGLAQPANVVSYFPVGVQWETTYIRDSAYYRADINGANLANHPYPGRLMIRAELVPGRTVPVIRGGPSLCMTETDTLSTGSKITRFANRVIDVSSEYSSVDFGSLQTLGVPDVYPNHDFSTKQWVGSTPDGQREYIILGFPNPAPINFIDIYETLNPGAVDTVYVKNEMGEFVIVYMDTATTGDPVAAKRHISFDTTGFDVSEIRIALASDSISGFNGIDAVGIGLMSDTSTFATYQWSNGAVTQSIEISSAGSYSVTVTDALGCKYIDSIVIISPTQIPPLISIAGSLSQDTTFCQGGSITLKSDKTFGNLWSTDATSDSIIVTASGNYSLMFDDGTGCGLQQSNTIAVVIDTLPIPSIGGNLGICPEGMTTLDAGAGYASYLWSNNSTSQTIDVSAAGGFSVTVTDGNGCSGFSTGVTTFIATPPSPNIIGVLSFCPGDSTELDAGTYTAYSWSSGETTQKIFIKTAQTIFVTVTDAGGCTGSTNTATNLYPTPLPSIGGNPGFCPGESTMLTGGNGYNSYSWSTGSLNQSVVINAVGTYILTVTDNNGCEGSNSKSVIEYNPPEPFIAGSLGFCGGSSVQLKAVNENEGGFITYLWNTGQTSQGIFVDSAGTYAVTVTDINGDRKSVV